MTREEAVDIIKCLAWHTRPNEEDVEQAIKALEQEPREDCVSRKAVIKYIRTLSCDLSYWSVTDEVVKDIEALPSVTPTQKWIPVSERLPKEGETVLVCYQAQGGIAQSVCEWFDMPNRGIVWSTLCGRTPIAWMPLPEPYKAEMEDEE